MHWAWKESNLGQESNLQSHANHPISDPTKWTEFTSLPPSAFPSIILLSVMLAKEKIHCLRQFEASLQASTLEKTAFRSSSSMERRLSLSLSFFLVLIVPKRWMRENQELEKEHQT